MPTVTSSYRQFATLPMMVIPLLCGTGSAAFAGGLPSSTPPSTSPPANLTLPPSQQPDQGWMFDLSDRGRGLGQNLANMGIYLNGSYSGQALGEVSGGHTKGAIY